MTTRRDPSNSDTSRVNVVLGRFRFDNLQAMSTRPMDVTGIEILTIEKLSNCHLVESDTDARGEDDSQHRIRRIQHLQSLACKSPDQ